MTSHINRDALSEMANILEDDFPGMVKAFIENTTKLIQQLSVHILKNDAASFILTIHSLKGSSRNMCADDLADICIRYEILAKSKTLESIDSELTALIKEFECVKASLLSFLV